MINLKLIENRILVKVSRQKEHKSGWIAVKAILPSKKGLTGQWLGLTLLPQGGVVIGAAWVAAGIFPNEKEIIMLSIIGSTVFFEIIGPILLRSGLLKSNTL